MGGKPPPHENAFQRSEGFALDWPDQAPRGCLTNRNPAITTANTAKVVLYNARAGNPNTSPSYRQAPAHADPATKNASTEVTSAAQPSTLKVNHQAQVRTQLAFPAARLVDTDAYPLAILHKAVTRAITWQPAITAQGKKQQESRASDGTWSTPIGKNGAQLDRAERPYARCIHTISVH